MYGAYAKGNKLCLMHMLLKGKWFFDMQLNICGLKKNRRYLTAIFELKLSRIGYLRNFLKPANASKPRPNRASCDGAVTSFGVSW